MIQSAFTQRPILLSPSIRAGENPLTACYELGRELDRSASRVRKAWTVACENSGGPVEKRDPEALRVALLGHPYLLDVYKRQGLWHHGQWNSHGIQQLFRPGPCVHIKDSTDIARCV